MYKKCKEEFVFFIMFFAFNVQTHILCKDADGQT